MNENEMIKIKNMVDNGNIADAISQISPEMIQNFSKMLSNQNNSNINNSTSSNQNNSNTNNTSNNPNGNTVTNTNTNTNTSTNNNTNSNFDFSNIDMNTIMKMSSVLGKMNNTKDDPRANLLNSLKPYLRDSKKNKLDNYINLLNVTKIAELMKENNQESNKENNNNV